MTWDYRLIRESVLVANPSEKIRYELRKNAVNESFALMSQSVVLWCFCLNNLLIENRWRFVYFLKTKMSQIIPAIICKTPPFSTYFHLKKCLASFVLGVLNFLKIFVLCCYCRNVCLHLRFRFYIKFITIVHALTLFKHF